MGKELLTNGNHLYGYDYGFFDPAEGYRERNPATLFPSKPLPTESPPSSPTTSASSSSLPSSFSSGSGFIEHRVTKLDTLAGIAIKYGVEVADIKRVNGLTTDLQLFALKSIQIPLPGRHSPSPFLSNDTFASGQHNSDHTTNCRKQTPDTECSNLYNSFQPLNLKSSRHVISPAMSLLQGYYGLKESHRTASDGSQVAVCINMGTINSLDEGPFMRPYILSDTFLGNKEAGSSGSSLFDEYEESADNTSGRGSGEEYKPGKQNEILLKRRLKSEADLTSRAPERVLKEHGSKNGGGFSAITGKGLALRSKASYPNQTPKESMENFVMDGNAVRKSSSTPSLQDQNGIGIASIWRTSGWNLKPDLKTAVIPGSILDGLPKPLSGRKNKAAVD